MPLSLFRSLRQPGLDWIQVEVTTWCGGACIYCPRTVYQESWRSRHLSLDTFRRLLPALAQARLVHLQGWGEPLLHPHFFEMAALAKQAGARVSTTTNGMLLDEGMPTALVESGLEVVAFSLAGLGETNDHYRPGTSFGRVVAAIDALHQAKNRLGRSRPEIHLAYMLLRGGLKDLPRLPQTLGGLGISQVVISTLDFVASRELAGEALGLGSEGEQKELARRLVEVASAGEHYGMKIHHPYNRPRPPGGGCRENAARALVVGADGMASPCVFANLAPSGVTYRHQGQERPYRRLAFGNLNDRPLKDIWEDPGYSAWRRALWRRELTPPCQGCPKALI